MTSSTNELKLDSELESFRRKWLSDLQTKSEHEHEHDHEHGHERGHEPHDTPSAAGPSRRRPSHTGPPVSALPKKSRPVEDDGDWFQSRSFDDPPSSIHEVKEKGKAAEKKLISALDHYEEAMVKEAQGNMGDSLKLYRKAYRLDTCVDQTYREKHFPASKTSKPTGHQRSSSTTTAAISKPPQPEAPVPELPIEDLIASFTHLKIQPVPPEVEGMPQPPCPIAELPDEILIHIMGDVAIKDVGDFVRLAQVCKHFAFLVATEQRIYQRVAMGDEVGFAAMHYHWQAGVEWEPLEDEPDKIVDGMLVTMEELAQRRQEEKLVLTKALTPFVYPSWKDHFRSRPRIRFNGCYISTVNYVRTGQASTNQLTWGSNPIHIVTYYRYLRFFRDGTLISLLTTIEPSDVVHHLTRTDLYVHRGGAHAHLPSAVMAQALKGRWRLSSADDRPDAPVREQEGDVFIETEGVGTKYMYRLDLGLRSAGKGTRNNKLVWKGFYSYNKLSDDWAEFGLKNDKPFFFSRVKSYGVGE